MTPLDTGPTDATVAERVRQYRTQRGLTLPALAEAIAEATGYTYGRTVLGKIETGVRRVSAHDLVAIAAGLRVTPTDLLMPAADHGLALVRTSASAEPMPAEVLHRWLHHRGSGMTGSLGGLPVPVDEMADILRTLAAMGAEIEQLRSTRPQ